VDASGVERAASTAILYLLEEGDASRPHRIRSDETWHFYEGAPLVLHEQDPSGSATTTLLVPPPQGAYARTVPAGHWMAARSTGEYTLAGCTVAPGFEFEDLEFLEPAGPGQRDPHGA
jgi:predicted cupin superfamily sugar epimerase